MAWALGRCWYVSNIVDMSILELAQMGCTLKALLVSNLLDIIKGQV